MEPIYTKKLSFGKIFQYDENIATKAKLETKNNNKQENKDKIKLESLKTEIDREIDSNPFFFF